MCSVAVQQKDIYGKRKIEMNCGQQSRQQNVCVERAVTATYILSKDIDVSVGLREAAGFEGSKWSIMLVMMQGGGGGVGGWGGKGARLQQQKNSL
jgi:hypothetical protein